MYWQVGGPRPMKRSVAFGHSPAHFDLITWFRPLQVINRNRTRIIITLHFQRSRCKGSTKLQKSLVSNQDYLWILGGICDLSSRTALRTLSKSNQTTTSFATHLVGGYTMSHCNSRSDTLDSMFQPCSRLLVV